MFTAATALKKILVTKLTTYIALLDEEGDEFESFSEAEYNKAKKVTMIHVPDRHTVRADDLATVEQPKGIAYDDFLIPADKIAKITMVEIGGRLTTLEEFKKIKRNQTFRVDLRNEIGYEIEFTKDGINVGCRRHSWKVWETEGAEIIERHLGWSKTKYEVIDLLKLVIENKDKIIAKITNTPVAKKTVKKVAVKKVAAKKTTKKTAAKKTTKRK
jgi:hypothetical protein